MKQRRSLELTSAGALFGAALLLIGALGWWFPYRRAAPSAGHVPGITLAIDPSSRARIVVTSVQSGSEAFDDGVVAGDEVLQVDGQMVRSTQDVDRKIDADRDGAVTLTLRHADQSRIVSLRREGRPDGA
tara:strand:+ start:1031 stop:1420 length:390 start_codon:yes stop_codon:yes gene_type:complete